MGVDLPLLPLLPVGSSPSAASRAATDSDGLAPGVRACSDTPPGDRKLVAPAAWNRCRSPAPAAVGALPGTSILGRPLRPLVVLPSAELGSSAQCVPFIAVGLLHALLTPPAAASSPASALGLAAVMTTAAPNSPMAASTADAAAACCCCGLRLWVRSTTDGSGKGW